MTRKTCKLPMKKGQTLTIHAHGKTMHVKRIPGRIWFLSLVGLRERGRFANFADQACEDIAYFKETGALPRGKDWPPF